ncbi:MAG: hypothetical protein M3083_00615 [Actinomycetota bacterium]|nr:hypothetical protein [Actinomycetota bacterium]
MADEDLVRLRMSLAMASSLPGDQARLLLDEVETLRQMRRDLTAEIDSLANQVEGLRRVLGGPLTSQ